MLAIFHFFFSCKTLKILTPIVVSHSNVVTNHVRHCSGQQVRLVHIDIDADADGPRSADRLRYSHTSLAARKRFAAVKIEGRGRMESRPCTKHIPFDLR